MQEEKIFTLKYKVKVNLAMIATDKFFFPPCT